MTDISHLLVGPFDDIRRRPPHHPSISHQRYAARACGIPVDEAVRLVIHVTVRQYTPYIETLGQTPGDRRTYTLLALRGLGTLLSIFSSFHSNVRKEKPSARTDSMPL